MADRTVSVKLTANVAEYIAQMNAAGKSTRDLEQADRNLRKAQDDAENAAGRARVSESALADARANSKTTTTQLAAAEEQHDANLRKLETSIRNVTSAEKDYQDALLRSRKADDDSSKAAQNNIDSISKKAISSFSPLAFAGLSLGLPAAAAAGVAGVGLALGGVATLFAGLGVAIAAQDDEIAAKFHSTMGDIKSSALGMGASFKTEVSSALDDVSAAWGRMAPAVSAAVNASAPAVRILTGAVTDLAENAMPGMVTAVQNSQPALEGLRALSAQTGSGLSDFFTNISAGSQSADTGLSNLGGTVQLLLGRLGTLFANLSNGSAGPLNSLHVIVDQVTGALNSMTASGSGVLGFFQGFTNASSGMLSGLSLITQLISLIPPQLSQMAGSFVATASIASKFGADVGSGFKGMSTAVSDATGGIGKASAALEGLSLGAINPALLIVGALSVGLNILGQSQAAAAAAAAAHAKNVQDLTEAMRADNGVLGANSVATVAKALQDKNAAANVAIFGESLGEATAAATGNTEAMGKVTTSSNQYIESLGKQAGLSDTAIQGLVGLNNGLLQNGGSYDTVKTQMAGFLSLQSNGLSEYQNGLSGASAKTVKMTGDQVAMLQQLLNGTGAIGEQAKSFIDASKTMQDYNNAISGVGSVLQDAFGAATGGRAAVQGLTTDFSKMSGAGNDAAAAGKAIIDVMRVMSGQAPSVDEAMQAWNDHMRLATTSFAKAKKEATDFKDGMIDASGAIDTTSQSGSELQDVMTQAASDMATYGKTLKDSGQSADQITPKLASMRSEFQDHLKTLGLTDAQIQSISDHYGLIPAKIVTTLGLEGDAAAQQQISNIVGQLKSIPPDKTINVKTLSDSARQALTDLGYQILQLPDGTFQIGGNTDKGKTALADFKKTIDGTFGIVRIDSNDSTAQATLVALTTKMDGTVGLATLDARVDPATGQVEVWKRNADGTWGWSNLSTRIDPATGQVQAWVRDANGTWAWANMDAKTAAAEAALNQAARDRTATITVKYTTAGGIPQAPAIGPRAQFADGGVARMASGGLLGMAGGGGLSPMSNIAAKIPPNTWRVIGDRMKDDEYYIPADGSARSRAILSAAMTDPKLGNIGSQIAQGYASVGAMSQPIVIQAPGASSSAGLSPQMVTALLGQMVAAVQHGLSQAEFSLDSRGVATAGAKGRALNALR